jgi:hypothetical protein
MSIPILGRATRTFLPAVFFPELRTFRLIEFVAEVGFSNFPTFDSPRGEIESPGVQLIRS